MEKLPQELIDRIVSFTRRREWRSRGQAPSNFPSLATISQKWKEAIEVVTFYKIDLKNTEIEDFRRIVSGKRRWKVKEINLTIILSEYSKELYNKRETPDEHLANCQSFTKSLSDLFKVLKDFEDAGLQTCYTINLAELHSESDPWLRDSTEPDPDKPEDWNVHERYDTNFLELVEPEKVPELQRCLAFSSECWYNNVDREFTLPTLVHIARKFRQLRYINWIVSDHDFEEYPSKKDRSRRKHRQLFASALDSTSFPSLETARIEFDDNVRHPELHQTLPIPSIIPIGYSYDLLSASLRRFSQNLTSFVLKAVVGDGIFWPTVDKTNQGTTIPYWPHIKTCKIYIQMVTPSGGWYFTGNDPGTADPRRHYYPVYRIKPILEVVDPLFLAFAKAAQRIPKLEVANIEFCFLDEEIQSQTLAVVYRAPGQATYGNKDESPECLRCRRIYYNRAITNWMPTEEVRKLCLAIGKDKHRAEAIERII